jgi:hypothetical protein
MGSTEAVSLFGVLTPDSGAGPRRVSVRVYRVVSGMMGRIDSDGERDAVQTSKGHPLNRRPARRSRIAPGGVRASTSRMGPGILATLETEYALDADNWPLTLCRSETHRWHPSRLRLTGLIRAWPGSDLNRRSRPRASPVRFRRYAQQTDEPGAESCSCNRRPRGREDPQRRSRSRCLKS